MTGEVFFFVMKATMVDSGGSSGVACGRVQLTKACVILKNKADVENVFIAGVKMGMDRLCKKVKFGDQTAMSTSRLHATGG